MRRTTILALLTALLVAFATIAILSPADSHNDSRRPFLGKPTALRVTNFCAKRPRHPKCQSPSPTPSPTTPPPPPGTVCTNPTWSSSEPDVFTVYQIHKPWDPPHGIGYYGNILVHNNMWNAGGYNVAQTTYSCNHDSFYTVTRADNSTGDGAVKTYPNAHVDYIDWGSGRMDPLANYSSIKMRFGHVEPESAGIWNFAYDVWLNGVGDGAANELMIWTDNHNHPTPAGIPVRLAGVDWKFFTNNNNHYLAFVPAGGQEITSGEFDLIEFTNWLSANGYIPANSVLGQIGYGVEIVSTGGQPARFDFTDFWITETPR